MRNGQGLKLEKIYWCKFKFKCDACENHQNLMVNARWWNLFDMFFITLLDHFAQVFVHFVQAFSRVAWLIYVGFFLGKTIWRFCCVISFSFFWKFSRLGNLAWAWDFLGVWFLPPGIRPSPSLEIRSTTSIIWVDFGVRVCTAIPRSGGK